MPKVDLRNKVGAVVHAVVNRVLSNHTARNIYSNVNYAKTFIQGTVVNVFDDRMPGGKNAIWKLMVNFKMPSDKAALGVELKRIAVYQQNCILGPVPAVENPQYSVNFTDLIAKPNHATKGSMTYLPSAKGRAAAASTTAAASAAPCVLLLPVSHIAETASNKSRSSLCPLLRS
jgi:hypothetical protein